MTFTATLHNITEGNRIAKSAAFTEAIIASAKGKIYKPSVAHNADDGTKRLGTVTMHIHNFDVQKAMKAARTMAFSLDVPPRSSDYGEHFVYKAHEDLCDRHAAYFASMLRELYDAVIAKFGLPNVTIMTKSGELRWRGQILYSSETGQPIKQADWDKFVKDLEAFLNRKTRGSAKRIILTADALGRILDRMLKTNSLSAVQAQRLMGLKYKGKTFDWISDDVKHIKAVCRDTLTRGEQARVQAVINSCAERISGETDAVKASVKQILVDGIRERKGKSAVSQKLFDTLVGHNRNYHRIADTETMTAMNSAFVHEEVQQAAEGERVYFKRVEIIDDNTCKYCKGMNGTIAVWSETPVSGEIDDPVATVALWDGKEWGSKDDPGMGAFHPWCRGVWLRYTKKV